MHHLTDRRETYHSLYYTSCGTLTGTRDMSHNSYLFPHRDQPNENLFSFFSRKFLHLFIVFEKIFECNRAKIKSYFTSFFKMTTNWQMKNAADLIMMSY